MSWVLPFGWAGLLVFGALFFGIKHSWSQTKSAYGELHGNMQSPRVGWVYFISAVGGEDDDPPAPIKIGMTHRNPQERLPEIGKMSPNQLELLWAIPTTEPEKLEATIHHTLSKSRRRGEWYDREATLAYIDWAKGVMLK